LATYICMAKPSLVVESPWPAIVFRPCTKSTAWPTGCGIGNGCQHRACGMNSTLSLDGRKLASS
jgi:hypothetical protein